MAVEINAGYTLIQVSAAFDIPVELVSALSGVQGDPVLLKFTPSQVVLVRSGNELAVVNVSFTAIKMGLLGTLGPGSKKVVQSLLETAYLSAAETLGLSYSQGSDQSPEYKAADAVSTKTEDDLEAEDSAPDEVVPQSPVAGVKNVEDAMNLPRVPLMEAEVLYQPVGGTDGTSVYYAVALSKDIKMAARVKSNGSVSVRVEGSLDSISKQLSAAGLDSHGTKSHWSVHTSTESKVMARRVVGAVLIGIGHDFDQAVSNIDPIYGKGA